MRKMRFTYLFNNFFSPVSLTELVNQQISEIQQTNTVIEKNKQEVKQTLTIVNSQIGAMLDKQALIQNEVDKSSNKADKCEEKCRQALSDMANDLSAKQRELNDATIKLQTLYTELLNLRKNVGEVAQETILHKNDINKLGTAMNRVFQTLGL